MRAVLGEQAGERRPNDPGGKTDDVNPIQKSLSGRGTGPGSFAFRQPCGGVGKILTDLPLVFPEQRRAALDTPGSLGELIRVAGKTMTAQFGVSDLGDVVSMFRLFVDEESARRINRRGGQAQRLEFVKEFFDFVIERTCFDQTVDNLAQGKPILRDFVFRIEQLRWTAEPLDKAFPVIRLVDEDARISVAALVSLRHGGRLAMSGALGYLAGDAVTSHDAQKRIRGQDILQRHVDMLAAARGAPVKQRHESAEGGMHGT